MINEADPNDSSNIEMFLGHPEDKRKQCPHLRGDRPGEYWCYCHNKPWYNQTPCYEYSQIERNNSLCRTGAYFMKNLSKELVNAITTHADSLSVAT